jgi:putative ABC transport system permease protein
MYYKLSFKNVKKSFKDYTLYFLTLTFGVCIFYIFNSIEAQKAMMRISKSTQEMMKTITWLMGVISIFVSLILGFLIVYANNFLIRRRKKEIGIYMTLGMEKRKVVKLLVAETFLIGVLSLGAGLLAGVFLSQGLSVVTAKLFEADMTGYRFIFSPEAFVKTIIYFGIIFLIVMVASTISISKYKLINLINADKQNEKQKFKNPIVTVILFILSIVFIGAAYRLVLKNGITYFDNILLTEIVLGAVGTFLFFASLSGFFLKLLQSRKKLYFKGLNMFILRQINSRVNSAYISMSLICLMLFVTIGILSTGMGINSALNKGYENCTPYDASFTTDSNVSIYEKFKEYGFNLHDYTDKFVEFSLYNYSGENLTKKKVLDKVDKYIPEKIKDFYMNGPLYLLKLSDFNKLMDLQGKDTLSLSEKQLAVYSDYADSTPELKKALTEFIKMGYPVTISGKDYQSYSRLITDAVVTSPASGIILALIVPDKMVEGSPVNQTILSFNCKGDSKDMLLKLESDLFELTEKYKDKKEEFKISGTTKETVKSIAAGSKAIVSFVGIYLGIIFLITSAAILALQQLSEAADNRRRYDILRKIGADDKLINSALFKQIAIYFMLPLILSCIHSIIGLKVANDLINDLGEVNATNNIIITAVLITLVYGAYFLATYFSSKRIVLKSR